MAGLNRLRLFYLLHLSKPAHQRLLYRELRRQKARKIVEIGIGDGQRALQLIELLQGFHEAAEIHYAGVDRFEARSAADGPGLKLRDAHRLLKATGAQILLAPGAVDDALARVANGLRDIDAVILSAGVSRDELLRASFYLPRMIHSGTQFFEESLSADRGATMRLLTPDEISRLTAHGQRRAA